MSVFLKLLKLYINSSIHVALAAVSFLCITYLDFNLQISIDLTVFVFFSTLVAYNFVKYVHLIKQKQHKFSRSLKFIITLSIFSIAPIFISLLNFQIHTLFFIVILGIFTLLYVLPFFPRAKNLRDVSGLKVFIIAIVWTGTTVVLPFISSEIVLSSLGGEFIWYSLSRFLIVIALIIPFEIRDLNLDAIYLKTLPQVFGVFQTKILAISATLLSFYLLSFVVNDTITFLYIHSFVIFLVLLSKRHNAFLYTALLVESVPILWLLLKIFRS